MKCVSTSCVVLFDIDGTLISGPRGRSGAGVFAMNAASIEVTGRPSKFTGADYAGRTDVQIARLLIEDEGTLEATTDRIQALLNAYIRHLSTHIDRCPFQPIGNPRAAVTALRQQGAIIGLGTGNIRTGASLKLHSAGIGDLFDPLVGGFGDDGETRAALLEHGARALNADRSLPVFVVGDTPRDVEGALEIGAACIGIPFGKNTPEMLLTEGAVAIVETIDEHLSTLVRNLMESKR